MHSSCKTCLLACLTEVWWPHRPSAHAQGSCWIAAVRHLVWLSPAGTWQFCSAYMVS